jgi:hypothetical protein
MIAAEIATVVTRAVVPQEAVIQEAVTRAVVLPTDAALVDRESQAVTSATERKAANKPVVLQAIAAFPKGSSYQL